MNLKIEVINIIEKELGHRKEMFIRLFFYLGEMKLKKYEGEKPMKIEWEFEKMVLEPIYEYLTKPEYRVYEKLKGKEDMEFFKAWLRGKYAESIRPGKKGAENEDFELIGTRYHNWIRKNTNKIGLNNPQNYYNFVMKNIKFFSDLHLRIFEATDEFELNLQSLYYIDERGLAYSLYYPLLMSPIKTSDSEAIILKKIKLVSFYLEMFIVFRSVNRRNYSHSSIRYTMYNLVKEIRNKDVEDLKEILKTKVSEFKENLEGMKTLILHSQNRRFIRFLLTRMTNHIENESHIETKFTDYVNFEMKKPFEIEHIWANKYEEHRDEFQQRDEFSDTRNSIGALILVQKGFNQSFGDLPYEKKLPHYFGQKSLLTKSLHPNCYERNPSFLTFVRRSNLPFGPKNSFKKQDIFDRTELYKEILKEIYHIDYFDKIIED